MPSVGDQRFAQALARWLDYHESTALEVLQDLMPVLPVLDPSSAELLYSRGDARYHTQHVSAAVAGQFSFLNISNPLASGKLVVIERVEPFLLVGVAATLVDYRFLAPAATPGATAVGLAADGRNVSAGVVRIGPGSSAAPPGVFFWQTGIAAEVAARMNIDKAPVPFVLAPDQTLSVICGTVNTGILANFTWRERSVTGAESQRW